MQEQKDAAAQAHDLEDARHRALVARVEVFEARPPVLARKARIRARGEKEEFLDAHSGDLAGGTASWLHAVARSEEGLITRDVEAWRSRERVALKKLGDRPSKLRQWRARNAPPAPCTLLDWSLSRPGAPRVHLPAAAELRGGGAGPDGGGARSSSTAQPSQQHGAALRRGGRKPPPLAAMRGSQRVHARPLKAAFVRVPCTCGFACCCGWDEQTWEKRWTGY